MTRMDEHDQPANEPMYQHLTNCAQYAEYLQFYALPDIDAVNTIVSKQMHLQNVVTENTKIIDHNGNWAHFQYLEAYCIKTMTAEFNIYIPGQNIWQKVKKYSKIGQDLKNVIFNFACFLTTVVNV